MFGSFIASNKKNYLYINRVMTDRLHLAPVSLLEKEKNET